jgi:hypothetical protein
VNVNRFIVASARYARDCITVRLREPALSVHRSGLSTP